MKRFVLTTLLVAVFAAVAAADINRVGTIAEGREFPRIVDLDGNGIDDLVHDTFVLLGQGAGQFIRRELGFGGDTFVVDWLDVNGDGRVDLMTKNYGGMPPNFVRLPAYQIHIATGAPLEFGPAIEITPLSMTPSPAGPLSAVDTSPMIGDLNDDGKDDFLFVRILFKDQRDYAAELTVHLSRGDGTFEKRKPFLIPSHPQWERYGHRLLTGDLNNDGRRDVVIRSTRDLVVLTGTGGGDFTVRSRYLPVFRTFDFGWWEHDLGDIDRDGNLDLVAAGSRHVRVFFGDGRSGFNRTSKLVLPRQTFPNLPPHHANYVSDSTSAPRSLHVGEFVTKGRTEILGALAEGDVFVVAYENGRLREVAPRIVTEFIQPDVFVGSFRQQGSTDFTVTDNFIYGPGQPRPGLFYANPTAAAVTAAPARSGRSRAVAQPVPGNLTVSVNARDCAEDSTIKTLQRDGIFGSSRHGSEAFDAVIDEDGLLYFRYVPKWEPNGIWGVLPARAGGGWEGTVHVWTPCGEQDLRITVER